MSPRSNLPRTASLSLQVNFIVPFNLSPTNHHVWLANFSQSGMDINDLIIQLSSSFSVGIIRHNSSSCWTCHQPPRTPPNHYTKVMFSHVTCIIHGKISRLVLGKDCTEQVNVDFWCHINHLLSPGWKSCACLTLQSTHLPPTMLCLVYLLQTSRSHQTHLIHSVVCPVQTGRSAVIHWDNLLQMSSCA